MVLFHFGKAFRHGLASLLLGSMLANGAVAAGASSPSDAADALNEALHGGDEARVRSLLADDVLIYEAGGEERSRGEYAAHHLAADIAFMAKMERQVLSRRVYRFTDGAVVSTRSRLRGSYKGRAVDSVSTETVVMRRQEGAWKVVHVHWSSR